MMRILLILFLVSCQPKVEKGAQLIFERPKDNAVVATLFDKNIKGSEMFKNISGEIYEKEIEIYEMKMNTLRAKILKELVEGDPRKKNLSNDEFLNKFIAPKIKITKKEIIDFGKSRGLTEEQLSPDMGEKIKSVLVIEKRKEEVEKWVALQTQKNKIKVFLEKPDRPQFVISLKGDEPFWGGKDALVTIVEYTDFQCAFCAKGAERIREVKKKYGNKVKIVYKDFPLPYHKHAIDAAEAAYCAGEQGNKNFWKAYDYLFANQEKLARSELMYLGRFLKIKEDQFKTCFSERKYQRKIEQNFLDAQNIPVKKAPTFFINGRLVNGARPEKEFFEEIDRHL